jgi:VCBS repeat-containing protein
LRVTAVNDVPVAIAQSVSTSEDRPVSITLAASDIEGDALTFEITAGPANGSLALTATAGRYTYTPNANFNGTDEFTFTASDGTPSAPATVTISVGPVNDAPIASDDQYAVDEDNVLTAAGIQSVLANDTDADGDPLTASHVAGQGPSSGTLTFNANGTFTYTPSRNFHGVDAFRYQATDGKGGWTSATVTITVNPINDAPAATDDRGYTVSEDQTLTTTGVTGVLANDTDVDDAQLTALVVTPPASGSLTLNADGSFTYKPNADFSGTDSFVYRASDGRLTSNDATVTIAVETANDAPVAADDAFDVVEDTPRILSVLANDSDTEASPLTPQLVDGQGPANGVVTINPGGTFTYTPNANFNGSDGFLYTVSDGSASSNAARVTITVTPVNDAPVAQPQAVTTDEHAPVAITLAGQDVENSQLAYRITAQPSHGSLSGEGNVYTYTPEANYRGDDAFSFVVNDGTDDSEPATVSITVSGANDIPTATADQYAVDEDKVLTVGAGQSVLANDTDADGDALTASLGAGQGPSSGTLDLNADGTFSYTPNANFYGTDGFTYQASDGSGGTASTTVTITVNPVNDAPSFVKGGDETVTENAGPQTVTGWATQIGAGPNEAGQTLNFSVTTNNAALFSAQPNVDPVTGNLTYTPAANAQGSATVTVTLRDDGGTADGGVDSSAPQTFAITVSPINDAPTATADGYSTAEETPITVAAPGILANDSDLDGDPLTATMVVQPSHGSLTLNADGSFTYAPDADFTGDDSFTYKATDGALQSAAATVTITVTAVNDAPAADSRTVSTAEDTPIAVTVTGRDPDGDALTFAITTPPMHGSLAPGATSETYTYTPDANFTGSDEFTFTAADGSTPSAPATVSITVVPVNDGPSFVKGGDQSVSENVGSQTVVGWASAISAGPADEAGQVLSFEVTGNSNPALFGVAPAVSSTGALTYTPAANASGSATITVVLRDDGGTNGGGIDASAPQSFTITVSSVNSAPSFTAGANQTVVEDAGAQTALGWATQISAGPNEAEQTLTFNVATSDDALFSALPTIDPATGDLRYTPEANGHGSVTVTVTLHDNGGTANGGLDTSPQETFTITVTPVNDAPVATDDSYRTSEDTPLTVPGAGVLSNDSDVDGDALTAVVLSGPTNGTLTLNADGSFTYTPNANYSGPDGFTYRAEDRALQSNVATVTITVTAVNDRPVAQPQTVTTDEDTPASVTLAGADTEGNPLTYRITAQPSQGTLSGEGNVYTYTPAANYSGDDAFSFVVNDGTEDSAPATVSIRVTAANDAPSATADRYAVAEDNVLTVAAAQGILTNDSDVDGDAMTAVVVGQPTHGTLTLNADGSFTYTPAANFTGDDSFTYTATDRSGAASATTTVSIAVTPVNDAPAVDQIADQTADEGTLVTFTATATDREGDAVTFSLVGAPEGAAIEPATGVFTWTPSAAQGPATYTFAVLATDNGTPALTGERQVTITITEAPIVNTAPQALNDAATVAEDGSQTIQVLTNDVDAEGDALSTAVVAGPEHGTVVHNADESFSYTPAANFNGTDVFTYQASDGSLTSNTATVTITVTAVNDAPTAGADSYNADEDKQLVVAAPGVLANDTDLDGQALSATLASGPANGTLTLNGNGSFTYTPNLHFSGNDAFSYRATDGLGSSDAVSVAITVKARMTVILDIIPGSSTNSIGYSTSQTEIVFAVLSTATFDATLVDPATTTLGDDKGTDTPLAKNADGSFKFLLTDVNGDGRRDFYAYVNKAAMKANGDLTLTTTSMTVLGRLKAPRTELFRGKDKVTVVP